MALAGEAQECEARTVKIPNFGMNISSEES